MHTTDMTKAQAACAAVGIRFTEDFKSTIIHIDTAWHDAQMASAAGHDDTDIDKYEAAHDEVSALLLSDLTHRAHYQCHAAGVFFHADPERFDDIIACITQLLSPPLDELIHEYGDCKSDVLTAYNERRLMLVRAAVVMLELKEVASAVL
jgi:hypothetical protein